MDGYKDCAALRVGPGGAVVEGGILVAQAGLHHLQALRLQRAADLRGEFENDLAFVDACCAAGAEVRATVSGVKDHGVQDVALDVGGEIVGRLRGCRCALRGGRGCAALRGRGGRGLRLRSDGVVRGREVPRERRGKREEHSAEEDASKSRRGWRKLAAGKLGINSWHVEQHIKTAAAAPQFRVL